jgi:hypothetical protein
MLVVANNQHLPLFFWSVRGAVLKSIWVLKTCKSAIRAGREIREDLISVEENTARASCARMSDEISDSQADTLSNDNDPSVESGEQPAVAIDDTLITSCFSSTFKLAAAEGDLEDAEPIGRLFVKQCEFEGN